MSPARRPPEVPAEAGRHPRSSCTDPSHRRSSRTVEGELTLSRAPGRVQTMVRRVSAAFQPSRPHRPATNATTTGITGNRGPGYPVAGAQSGARSAGVCGSSAGTPGWKGLLLYLLWAHGPATSVHGCHRQKGAPCALRETAVGGSLPCTGPGKGSSTMCGKSRLGIENGIVALPVFCHTRCTTHRVLYSAGQVPVYNSRLVRLRSATGVGNGAMGHPSRRARPNT